MMRQRPKRASGCLWVALLSIILIFIIGIAYTKITRSVSRQFGDPDYRLGMISRLRHTFILYQSGEILKRTHPFSTDVKIEIAMAEKVNSVCDNLQNQGLVRDSKVMCSYLVYTGFDRGLQAGKFTILPAMTAIDIAQRISNPRYKDVQFTIYPGWRMEEVASAVNQAGLPIFESDIFLLFKLAPQDFADQFAIPFGMSVEGYLCPGTYAIKPETMQHELLTTLTACHEQYLSDGDFIQGLADHGINYFEAITLASIIQRETLEESEMPLIASVFYNRLAQNMMLQTDPTVQYALGFDEAAHSWWKTPLTLQDLEVDSPYNTYLMTGLPPGPISAPSRAAFEAVAFPAQSDYLYFRAKCDGSNTHDFSITYDEHLSKGCP